MRRIGIIIVFATLIVAGIGLRFVRSNKNKVAAFLTVPVKRGDLVSTISATGTLEPEQAVDVGAQVAGIIVAFGKDKRGKDISWGSEVEPGTVLARIDDSLYAAAVATAKAQLSQGEANLLASQANVLQQKANLVYATQNWERAQKLGPSDALARSAYDQYESTYEVDKANLAAAEAAVEQAKAAVEADKATLQTAQINLNYCTIKSPVKGVVIDRRVNIGQTVVSSLSAPSLFLISSDLRHTLQAWISVNEADVGSLPSGSPVTFTVDAIPNRVFQGRVGQVRLNATMTQNVVTYTVEVDLDNSDGKLIPYLTANAQFEIARRNAVLMVPNAALHWSPQSMEIEPGLTEKSSVPSCNFGPQSGENQPCVILWIAGGQFVRPVSVSTGLTDGAFTEVESPNLVEGLRVVTGETNESAQAAPGEEQNPFAPQVYHGQRPTQGQGDHTAPPSGRDQGRGNQ